MQVSLVAAPSATTSPRLRETVVVADNVEKVFAGGVVAVEGASFSIRNGQFVSILGPSGCGKSTLLRMIAGLVSKSGGSLTRPIHEHGFADDADRWCAGSRGVSFTAGEAGLVERAGG